MSEEKKVTKNSTFDEKVTYLRESMAHADVADMHAARNIYGLLYTQSLLDEFFKDESVIFTDLVEFADIKTALKEDIAKLKLGLASAYLSIITSCRPLHFVKPEQVKKLPVLYTTLMGNLGVFSLNTILSGCVQEAAKNVYLVDNGVEMMSLICGPLAVLNDVVGSVFGDKK